MGRNLVPPQSLAPIPLGSARDADETAPLLTVKDLRVRFRTEDGWVTAVDGLSFDLKPRTTLGIVGESGSGKSVTNLAVMRLLPTPPAEVTAGALRFGEIDLMRATESEMRRIRGNRVAMIFQDPMTSLNPYMKVGAQLTEVLELHARLGKKEARAQALAMLERVGIPAAARRFDQYPHQFSGGMRQRVMIAMMLLNRPEVLIADEPTTALDVTIQAQILDLLKELQAELGMAITLITHDLGVVAGVADEVIVMYAGRVMESGPVGSVFAAPSHAYTLGLLQSIPRADKRQDRLLAIPGRPPDPGERGGGCPFAPRCSFADDRCRTERPPLIEVGPGHQAACHRVGVVREAARGAGLLSVSESEGGAP